MTNDIIPGHDCCRDYQDPNRNPRIHPSKITMNAGENINLYLLTVHPDCYESCFTWRVKSGGGYVDPEFGIETYYHAPEENEGCAQNPVVECRCPRELVGRVHIAINGYAKPGWAYITAGQWKSGVGGVGTTCTDPLPFYPWDPWISGTVACIRLARRNCDKSVRDYNALTIMAMVKKDPKKGYVDETDRFYSSTGILTKEGYGKIMSGSYAECKQGVINARVLMWVGAWIEAQSPKPTFEQAREIVAGGGLLRPGGVLDVRAPKMLKEGCCNYDLIPEE